MNHVVEYIFRSCVRSEDAICRLNKNVRSLTKCNYRLGVATVCIGVGALMVAYVVAEQDKEIKALQKQVSDLAIKMEEQNQQKGA